LIGLLYQQGFGVEKDYKEAARLFQEGARKGNLNSILNLGPPAPPSLPSSHHHHHHHLLLLFLLLLLLLLLLL